MQPGVSQFRHWAIMILYSILFISQINAQTEKLQYIILSNSTQYVDLGGQMEILEDDTGSLTPGDVTGREFIRPGYCSLTPSGKTVYWLRFAVFNRNSPENEWLLEYNFFRGHTRLELFDPLDKQGYQFDNPALPFAEKSLAYRNPLFRLNIPQNMIKTFYLRIEVVKDFYLNLRLWNPYALMERTRKDQFFFGIFAGIILIMAFYNLFLFFSFRDKSYLYYIAFIVSLGWLQLNSKGLLTELLPFLQPFDYEIASVFKVITGCFFVLFSRSLLGLDKRFPRWDKFLRALLVLLAAAGVLNLFFYRTGFAGMLLLGIAGIVVVSLAVYRFIKKDKIAGLYLLATAILFVSGIIAILPSAFISFLDAVNAYLVDTGFLIMIFLFSFSLTNRINQIRLDKERAQQQAIEAHQKAIEGLQKADRLKDEFLANTSHELRTPLHGIIGITRGLIDGSAGKLSDQVSSRLQLVITSGKRLFHLVNDILDFRKIKENELSLQIRTVDISTLAETILAMTAPLAESRKIRQINQLEPELLVKADENRLQQILFNLVDNAIKFTKQGDVGIRAEVHGQMLAVSVQDTGIGIRETEKEKIFEYFYQTDQAPAREYGGTGLGLTITKKLVELQGGQIDVVSEPGKGSCFTFTLPLADSAEPGEEKQSPALPAVIPAPEEMPDGNNDNENKILIVDDDPVNTRILSDCLTLQNYSPVSVLSGEDALDRLEANADIHVVLLDLMMPHMSGFEVCRKIREKFNLYEKPVLMLTARTQAMDIVDGFNSGANDYLTKPFNQSELLSRVKTLFNLKRLTDSNNELQKVNELKSGLMNMIAHDLRNPLTAIMNYSGIMEDSLAPEEDEHKLLSKIRKSSHKMQLLINEFLQISRIEDGNILLTPERVNVAEIINNSVDSFIELAEKKRQRFIFPDETEPVYIKADKILFQEAVDNLVSNAIKYSPYNKRIWIDFRNLERKGRSLVRLEVKDEGPGLNDHDLNRVFGKFMKLSARPTGDEPAIGLGLAIARGIVEMHNGAIGVESRAGKGSTFYMEMERDYSELNL